MDRRNFIKSAGSLALAGVPAIGAEPPAVTQPTAAIRTGPYLQNPAPDAMTIMWMTTVPCFGYVEYGLTADLGSRADAEVDGLRQAGNLLHRVRIQGLESGKRYFYRVRCEPITTFKPYKIVFGEELTSPVHSFTTRDPASQKVRFLIYNDLHDNVKLWKELHALVAHERVDFVFLNGDITDYLQDEQQMVGHFLDVCTELFAKETPFLYTRGNHETRGAWSRQMRPYLELPDDRYYYGFSWGPVRFVVLDTGEDKPDRTPVYAGLCDFDGYRAVQQNWLAKETSSDTFASARFRIAIHHIPAYYNNQSPETEDQSENHGALDTRKKFWPILNQSKVDLYFGGHTHVPTIKPTDPANGHNFPVVIGGGPRKGIGTVMLVDVDQERIHVKMLGDDGHTIGAIEAKAV